MVVPRILARLFYDDVVWAVNGWFVQDDLTIFLRAGDAVLDGVSPYPAVSDSSTTRPTCTRRYSRC